MATLLLGVTSSTLLTLFIAAGVRADAAHGGEHVVALNDAEWEETPGLGASTRGEWVVNFYAPWCGQCKLLAPVWRELGSAMAQSDAPVTVGAVDCTLNPEVCAAQAIKGYPTILFFRDGHRVASYDSGDRDLPRLIEWALKKSTASKGAPSVAAVTAAAERARAAKTGADAKPTAAAAAAATAEATAAAAAASGASGTCTDEASCSYPQTVLNQLKALIRAFAANPLQAVRTHPLPCVVAVWLVGLMQGAFAGVVWALREQTRITRAIPGAAIAPVPHAHEH